MIDYVPYTNFHELNLDWIVKKVAESVTKVTDLEKVVKEALKAQDAKLEEQDADIKDLDNYVRNVMSTISENIEQITNDVLNQMIKDGELNVGLTYKAETEALDLVVTGGNNG